MADERGRLRWFSPDPRGIFDLNQMAAPRSLDRKLRNSPWTFALDSDFEAVIRGCADRPETWIDSTILEAYGQLHEAGFAHSLEIRNGGDLVGGLYGVQLGGAFFGESMFHRETDASKAALVLLGGLLRSGGFLLLDTQWTTPHLEKFGAVSVGKNEYLIQLQKALQTPARWGHPHFPKSSGRVSDLYNQTKL
jgi:leucyl/phenylalanyl-tRNA--protein transferase